MQYEGTEHGLQNMINAVIGIVGKPSCRKEGFLFCVFSFHMTIMEV
ncbi:hypothetical protein GK1542 [Geobacillus kaustophilus HTA426]|uniref:Uncharacterized protein n=1 Tax=Geobacillus kaustophilus (strain HTA426) TaxID=235909 RepID=Q5KZQ9_GEOKA|nr:hypothetical protein GK1542 [Geobacillus kaustophilus HTA426]